MRHTITAVVLLGLSAASNYAFASQEFAAANVPQIPSVKLNIDSGLWSGLSHFTTNGVTLAKNTSKCHAHIHQTLRHFFGSHNNPRYVPDNCIVSVRKNTRSKLMATEICVPFQQINQAMKYYKENGSIAGFGNYITKEIYAKKKGNGVILEVKENGAKNGKKFSQSVEGFYTLTSRTCPKPIKAPTLAELKKEGKKVPSNKELMREDNRNPAFKKAFG